MEVFGKDLISFGTHEHHLSITPDGEEIFFVIAHRFRRHHTIVEIERSGEAWLRPRVAPFSGRYNDFAPTPTPGGRTLLFCSNRPLPGETPDRADVNIWEVTRTDEGWGDPRPLPGRVNDESNEYNPTVSGDGTLIFSSARPGGTGGEGDLDFWVRFRGEDGAWSGPGKLGPAINTPSADAIITLSPDGEYSFFTNFAGVDPEVLRGLPNPERVRRLRGPENGDGTIYWISSSVLAGFGGG